MAYVIYNPIKNSLIAQTLKNMYALGVKDHKCTDMLCETCLKRINILSTFDRTVEKMFNSAVTSIIHQIAAHALAFKPLVCDTRIWGSNLEQ